MENRKSSLVRVGIGVLSQSGMMCPLAWSCWNTGNVYQGWTCIYKWGINRNANQVHQGVSVRAQSNLSTMPQTWEPLGCTSALSLTVGHTESEEQALSHITWVISQRDGEWKVTHGAIRRKKRDELPPEKQAHRGLLLCRLLFNPGDLLIGLVKLRTILCVHHDKSIIIQ